MSQQRDNLDALFEQQKQPKVPRPRNLMSKTQKKLFKESKFYLNP